MISGFTGAEELMTAAELARTDLPNKSTELVRGRLIVREPPGTYHGLVQSNLHIRVGTFVQANRLGAVFGQDTGFKIASDPDTVRAPDLAFVARERVSLIPARGYAAMAPDLVAEILSPDDRAAEVLAKIGEWLAAGVRLAWVIDPERVTAEAYRTDGSVAMIASDGALDGETVLPGFRCSLRDLCE